MRLCATQYKCCNLGIRISITGGEFCTFGKKRRKRGRLRERRGSFVDVVVSPPLSLLLCALLCFSLSRASDRERERTDGDDSTNGERAGPSSPIFPLLSPPSEKKNHSDSERKCCFEVSSLCVPFMLPSRLHPIHAPLLATTCKPSSSSSSALSDPR